MIDLPYAPPALPEQAIPPIWEKSLKEVHESGRS